MIPQLPPETISQIIQLSLPRPSYDSFRERADLLLSCSLVNRTWGEFAQQELFKHVTIELPEVVGPFLAAGESEPWLRERVRSLRVGTTFQELADWEQEPVEELLGGCSNVEDVWLSGVRNLKLGNLAQAASHAPLLRLGLCSSYFFRAENTLHRTDWHPFASLRTLSLVDPFTTDLITLFHSSRLFPSLETLVLARIRDHYPFTSFTPKSNLPQPSDLAPQLRSFSIEGNAGVLSTISGLTNLLGFFVRRCTGLVHFRISEGNERELLSAALATPVQHLWIGDDSFRKVYSQGSEALAARLRRLDAGESLSTIHVPPAFVKRRGAEEEEGSADELEQVCHLRGIALLENGEEGGWTWENSARLDW